MKELGCLALAITIVGTYVSRTPRLLFNLVAYLKDYRRRRQAILVRQPDDFIDRYDYSVITAWETSYAAVYVQLPGASWILINLAFINHEDIFLDLFGLGSHTSSTQFQPSWVSVIGTQSTITLTTLKSALQFWRDIYFFNGK